VAGAFPRAARPAHQRDAEELMVSF
jgi:hypothetical protein